MGFGGAAPGRRWSMSLRCFLDALLEIGDEAIAGDGDLLGL
jgi:hypothetical protein